MLNSIRNSRFLRFFWALMGLYLLNCSIDTNDFYGNDVPENLAINDQESIVELIVEKVLGFENAIPENDDCDSETTTPLKKTSTVDFFISPPTALATAYSFSKAAPKAIGFSKTDRLRIFPETYSPPPEV